MNKKVHYTICVNKEQNYIYMSLSVDAQTLGEYLRKWYHQPP